MTWYAYPYLIRSGTEKYSEMRLPALVTLSAMKVMAIQHRAKWKDYVDLSYLFPLLGTEYIMKITKEIFGQKFSEKIFAAQLVYTDDIDFSEEVEWVGDFQRTPEEAFEILKKVALELK